MVFRGVFMYSNSEQLFSEANKYIPGGVNSPVRAFKSVNMKPIYINRGDGSKIYDVDGNKYIDYVCSWGPLILGHSHERIIAKINECSKNGTSFGACTEIEIKFAKLISEIYPSIDLVRMVSSGTEATMSAIRLARGYTNKNKIIKFEGCYHGHCDSFLIKVLRLQVERSLSPIISIPANNRCPGESVTAEVLINFVSLILVTQLHLSSICFASG